MTHEQMAAMAALFMRQGRAGFSYKTFSVLSKALHP
jgi:hypothetical protein